MIKKKFILQKGQTIVEVLIAAGLIALIFPVMAQGFVLSRGSTVNREARYNALLFMRESLDAIRTLKENGWSYVSTNGTYHPVLSSNNWSLSAGSETIGNYTRQLVIADAQRDTNGQLIDIGGTTDPSTKKVTHLISWDIPSTGSIEYITYITRYLANAILQDTTTSEFTGGTFVNTETAAINDGAVILTAPNLSNTFIDEYTTPANYTYDTSKIEVTGGYAQLKYATGTLTYNTTNGGFDSGTANWSFSEDSTANPVGSYKSTGGNPGGYASIDYPTTKGKSGNGFWEQPFTITSASNGGYLTFQWKVVNYNGTPTTIAMRVWLDTSSGGTPSTQIWSQSITGVTSWSSTVNIDVSSIISVARTYYLKIGGYVAYPSSNRGPYNFGYDNVILSWSVPSANYPTDSPNIVPKTSFQALLVNSWSSFSTTEIPNGGSIGYQLSTDNGNTWYHYEGPPTRAWVASAVLTNDAATINSNISTFQTTNNRILVRAFLTSNGTQFVRLDNVTIGYNGLASANTGTYTSNSMDAGSSVSFNNISYTQYNTANTTTRIQIASNTDDASWSYVGPDGTSGTFYTGGNGAIPIANSLARYLRYKVYFDSSTTDQPYLEDITVNYSP